MINNYIKNKIIFYILGKRCKVCFCKYSIPTISKSIGNTGRIKFLKNKKTKHPLPIKEGASFPINGKDMKDLYTTRYLISPFKMRKHVPVFSLNMCCSECGNCREITII